MKVIKSELVVGVDIDDTLLMWDSPNVDGPNKVTIEFANKKVYLTPHQYHIDLLHMYHQRGYYIVFWSANGYNHAEQAVKVLGLESLASEDSGHVQSKPCKHMDDNPNAESILGPRVYCADLTKEIDGNTAVSQ